MKIWSYKIMFSLQHKTTNVKKYIQVHSVLQFICLGITEALTTEQKRIP